jgi:ABC-type multidrug transport system fused ATPase/permease subunit
VGIGLTTATIFVTHQSDTALGIVAVFLAAGFRVLPSTVRMLAALNSATVGLPSTDVVVAELEEVDDRRGETPMQGPAVATPFERRVVLDRVSFAYPGTDGDVVKDVSLTIPRGSSIALVGGSGAGKSTLVDLLLGLHSPRSGRILVDDRDITGDLPGWQANLAMVPQEVYLIDGTLRENVAFGVDTEQIDDRLVVHAVEQAQLSDLVVELPEGLDTPVGDRGARLSGGQRQRVGIARALYHEPSLIVLDEATSALDNLTERKIADTLHGLHGEVTTVIVAHRLSTIRDCDQILFLDSGRVDASGTFTSLQEVSPKFAELVQLGRLDTLEPSAGVAGSAH